jgi:hexokinase
MMQIKKYTISELQQIRENLVTEFIDANNGKKNSLAFAKNVIERKNFDIAKKEQVVVIGGSNLVTAIVEKVDGHIKVISQKSKELPVFKTKQILLDFILEHIEDGVDKIGLNFAYPMNSLTRDGKIEGELIRGTKEHTFDGLINQNVGQELEKYILEKTGRKVNVFVANDTVCLVLSGIEKDQAINLVGGVVGTGFNFGFFLDDNTVVNLESGNFNNFPQTDTGEILDKDSVHPGMQIWEKEIAGAYLYQHYNYYIDKFEKDVKKISSTAELSMIADGAEGDYELAQSLFERAASMVATQISAIYDFKGKKAITVIIEGSLYWKGWNFSKFVNQYLTELGIKSNEIKIVEIDNSSVVGAAHLVM